jgi:hypothetical protein
MTETGIVKAAPVFSLSRKLLGFYGHEYRHESGRVGAAVGGAAPGQGAATQSLDACRHDSDNVGNVKIDQW